MFLARPTHLVTQLIWFLLWGYVLCLEDMFVYDHNCIRFQFVFQFNNVNTIHIRCPWIFNEHSAAKL